MITPIGDGQHPTITVTTPHTTTTVRAIALAIGDRAAAWTAAQDGQPAPEPDVLSVLTDTGLDITWVQSRPGDELIWLADDADRVPAYAWTVRT